jgi:uncharacterized protein Yka (UPF0111/DUF47 family)
MVAKSRIVEELGETSLILPDLVRRGLAANDRAKVRMSALQAAMRHAADAARPVASLAAEARAAGLEPTEIDRMVLAAGPAGDDAVMVPHGAALVRDLLDDVEAMTRAAEAGDARDGAALRARLERERAGLTLGGDVIRPSAVRAMTSADHGGPDSLHRLVMDLHKVLNRLLAASADETVSGARVHGLAAGDRRAVEAFMRGLNRTRHLKFDHPGLDTTAARAADHLVIQNDIGTTDAHVLVVKVEDERVTVTYTDIHRERAKFFVRMFADFDAEWSGLDRRHADGLGEGGDFYLVTGTLSERKADRREAFLEAVGAALVFLIDWNKARKRLRQFIDKADAVRILDWAARHQLGHRAFLAAGGADLVNGAVQRIAASRIGYGVRLEDALGRAATLDFLKAVLRLAAESMVAGRGDKLIRDAVDAELARHLERTESELLQGVVRQAGFAREIAAGLADLVGDRQAGRGTDASSLTHKAKRIEQKADHLAVALRAMAERTGARVRVVPLVDAVEQAIDDLEEAAFLFSLVAAPARPAGIGPLARLCETATAAAEAVARSADAASTVPEGHRIDADDAIDAIGSLFELEHSADEHERATTAAVLTAEAGGTAASTVLECARKVERATDQFARVGHLLRAHVIGDLAH